MLLLHGADRACRNKAGETPAALLKRIVRENGLEDDPDAESDEKAEDSMAEAARNAAAAEKTDGSGHEEEKKNLAKPAEEEEKESLGERIMMTLVMIVSLVIALGLFMALPVFLASHVVRFLGNPALLSLF